MSSAPVYFLEFARLKIAGWAQGERWCYYYYLPITVIASINWSMGSPKLLFALAIE